MNQHNPELVDRDLKSLWHPCSQMKDYERFMPLQIQTAKGSKFTLTDGREIIDAISSWWCKLLGHGHPKLKAALLSQIEQFEHVLLVNTTNETIVQLSEKITKLCHLDKVFYASDGACAIEIAMKMSLQARKNAGKQKQNRFVALKNSYHGETCLALSASDLGLYKKPFEDILTPVYFIEQLPYVNGIDDPLWNNCETVWQQILPQLEKITESTTAIILEPIVQGAGGMKIYSQDFLKRLRQWTQQNSIHLIADEIMTGLGRTGLPLACQHADILPDFICLGKGLTGGWLPMSAVVTSNNIYELFYDDYANNKAFMHSHTFTGNPLAASVANACLEILETENLYQQVQTNAPIMRDFFTQLQSSTGQLKNIRSIGAIVAADLITPDPNQRLGYDIYRKAVELGAFLRPLGNTLYWAPPLNTTLETLNSLYTITAQAIKSATLNQCTSSQSLYTFQQDTFHHYVPASG